MIFSRKYGHQKVQDGMVIHGVSETREVLVNGLLLDPADSLEVFNHSPDGFNWGYAGSGPAQLALALLMVAGVNKSLAVRLHQTFKMDVISKIPEGEDFRMTVGSVRDWCRINKRKMKQMGEMLKDE